MKLKVYDMAINADDETGVDINSFVDSPAHMRSFETYGKPKMTFAIDEEKRIVTGVAIMADFLIYRNDKQLGEHYVKFSPDVIWAIRNKFFKNGFGNNTNVMHDTMVEGATLVESFIVNDSDDRFCKVPEILSKQKVTNGSWVVSYYVENDKLWEACKDGTFKGFSVEGYFDKIPTTIKTNMAKKKLAKGRFGKIAQVSKWTLAVDQDTFEEGTKLTTSYEDSLGERVVSPLSAGEYTTDSGEQILVDSNGVIRMKYSKQLNMNKNGKKKKSIFDRLIFGDDSVEETMSEATTVDGTAIFFDGDLAVGSAVMIEVDGEKVAAPAGDHEVEIDGKTYAISLDDGGVVTTMEEVEQMSAEAKKLAEAMRKIVDASKAQFAEMQEKIDKLESDLAIAQKGGKFSAAPKNSGGEEKKPGFKGLI